MEQRHQGEEKQRNMFSIQYFKKAKDIDQCQIIQKEQDKCCEMRKIVFVQNIYKVESYKEDV